jgi:hypothetical protein
MPARSKRPERYLVRVVAPDFTCGIVIDKGTCVEAAPRLHYCVGKSAPWCSGHFQHKQWRASIVRDQATLAL